jgi:hypothetical protein
MTSDTRRTTQNMQSTSWTNNMNKETLKTLWIFQTLHQKEEIWIPRNNSIFLNVINEQYNNQTNTFFKLAYNMTQASVGMGTGYFKSIHVAVLKNYELSGTEDG